MVKIQILQKILAFLIIFILISLIFWYASIIEGVTEEECWEAYEECMDKWGWLGIPLWIYCANGLAFCLLYM